MPVLRSAVLLAALAIAAAGTFASSAAAAAKATFASVVEQLHDAGSIDDAQFDAARSAAAGARSLLRKLPDGTSKKNLGDAFRLANELADDDGLTAGRVPVVTEIVARNTEYWNTGKALSYGARVNFTGSRIVWQFYPGAGLQPQWLGTFGAANAYAKSKSKRTNTALGQLLDETLALASPRAGGIAWESFFPFSGAAPVWVSGLSQGTAVQALARASQKLGRPDLLDAATSALGVFQQPPPEGVALRQKSGTHYLIYSTNPRLLVLNGFLQSLVGLYDYAQISGNPTGQALFAAGDRAAQADIPRYDTGAWSLYDGAKESDLGYHQLVTGFLANLCDRTQTAIYCDTASRFAADELEPPAVRILTTSAVVKRPVAIRFTLSKLSSIRLLVDGTTVASTSVGYGTRTLTWKGQRKPGPVTVTIDARDLNGNTSSVSKVITLKRK